MAITSSYLYSAYKEMMLGRSLTAGEALSITLSSSLFASFILESYDGPSGQTASTTGSYRSVFSSRATGQGNATLETALTVEVSSSAGVTFLDAADIASASVSAGQSIGGILIFKKITGTADSFPIALIDIGSPVTTNGTSINVNWDNGVNRIFSLT